MDIWLKRTLLGIAAALALGGSIAAYSQAESHWHGGPPSAEDMAAHEAQMLSHIGKELDLDAAQKAKLQALADLLHKDHQAMGSDHHAKMGALIAGNTFDRAGAQALVDEKLASIKDNAPALIAAAGDFFDGLNTTQQQKVRDFMAKHHDHMMMSHMPPPSSN